jgi:RimJ/RimL family protein N-acetyltransferase
MVVVEKIKLRGFKKEDAIELVALKMDVNSIKSFAGSPFPVNLDSEEEWISNMYPKGLKKTIYFAIEEISSQKFIGYCVARNVDYINRNAEFGLIFNEKGRGKGYAKVACKLFFTYLFNEINLHKLYSFVLKENTVAMKVYFDIGFIIEGNIRQFLYQDGVYKDVNFISLLKNKFNGKC